MDMEKQALYDAMESVSVRVSGLAAAMHHLASSDCTDGGYDGESSMFVLFAEVLEGCADTLGGCLRNDRPASAE